MKKFILLSFIASSLFSYDITMNKEFVKELKPDKLTISVNINTLQKNSKDVLDKLNNYSDFINSFKELNIKGGEFNTYPQYQYKNRERIKTGYRGNINFRISSQNEEKLKNFVSMLTSKNIDKDVDLGISSSQWKIDEKNIKQVQESLKFTALKWAEDYSEKLSSKLNKTCKVKSVNFDGYDYEQPPIVYARAESMTVNKSVPMPNKTSHKIKINPRFKFECN